jgi:hypothetical protein
MCGSLRKGNDISGRFSAAESYAERFMEQQTEQ